MNRIQMLDQKAASRRSRNSTHKRTLASAANSLHVEHTFFVPMHYERNYAYPLVIWLHGPCDDHRQVRQVMPHISKRNYVGVGIDSPQHGAALADDQQPWQQSVPEIVESMRRVKEAVEMAATRFNIARHRVFLAGFDGGGTMALRLALAAPEQFAGVASIGGPFPVSHHPMSNLLQIRKLPILIAHGRDSDVYPITQVCDELRLFHVAGMSLNLRQYPCGHELTTQMLLDFDAWMMEIVTGQSSSTGHAATQSKLEELN